MDNNNLKAKLELVKQQKLFEITGKIFTRPYNWGDTHLIPEILGFTPEPDTPYAEYWLCTHSKAPGQLHLPDDTTVLLEEAIKDNPEHILGHDVTQKFGD